MGEARQPNLRLFTCYFQARLLPAILLTCRLRPQGVLRIHPQYFCQTTPSPKSPLLKLSSTWMTSLQCSTTSRASSTSFLTDHQTKLLFYILITVAAALHEKLLISFYVIMRINESSCIFNSSKTFANIKQLSCRPA